MIGCGELAAMQVLPEMIEAFHKKYPLVSCDIFTANAESPVSGINLRQCAGMETAAAI